jgi:hypothetical protein
MINKIINILKNIDYKISKNYLKFSNMKKKIFLLKFLSQFLMK